MVPLFRSYGFLEERTRCIRRKFLRLPCLASAARYPLSPRHGLKTTLEKIQRTKKVTVGTGSGVSPFEFVKDGKIVGFGRDLLDEIAKQWGVEVEQH